MEIFLGEKMARVTGLEPLHAFGVLLLKKRGFTSLRLLSDFAGKQALDNGASDGTRTRDLFRDREAF